MQATVRYASNIFKARSDYTVDHFVVGRILNFVKVDSCVTQELPIDNWRLRRARLIQRTAVGFVSVFWSCLARGAAWTTERRECIESRQILKLVAFIAVIPGKYMKIPGASWRICSRSTWLSRCDPWVESQMPISELFATHSSSNLITYTFQYLYNSSSWTHLIPKHKNMS